MLSCCNSLIPLSQCESKMLGRYTKKAFHAPLKIRSRFSHESRKCVSGPDPGARGRNDRPSGRSVQQDGRQVPQPWICSPRSHLQSITEFATSRPRSPSTERRRLLNISEFVAIRPWQGCSAVGGESHNGTRLSRKVGSRK